MKTSTQQTRYNFHSRYRQTLRGLIVLSIAFLWSCNTPTTAQRVDIGVSIDLPDWAPYYNNANLVRYYYLPDIECYYDVRSREFIYMEDGEWMFGRNLPPVYAWFDLRTCFVVALDARVYQPWRHFHYYVAHYPRFYYRNVYRELNRNHNRPLRGFNENERAVVFNHREKSDDNEDQRFRWNESRREENNYKKEENRYRKEGINRSENKREDEAQHKVPEHQVEPTRPAQPMMYDGREIGRPVRVQKNMKRAEEIRVKPGMDVKQYRQK
jgi:hypothetical protein